MYNSVNLPLSKKKILKKTLHNAGNWLSPLLVSIIFVVIGFLSEFGFVFIVSIIAFIAFLLFFFFLASIILYNYYYYKLYYYDFKEDSAEIRKGVVSRATGHVRYERIQNIFVDQDILDRILGIYDVHYETAGEKSGFYSHIDGLNKENSEKLVAFLNSKTNDSSSTSGATGSIANEESLSQVKASNVSTNTADAPNKIFTRENIFISPKIIFIGTITTFIACYIIFIIFWWFAGPALYDAKIVSLSFLWIFSLIAALIIFIYSYVASKIWYKNFYFKFDNELGQIKTQIIAQKNSYIYYDRIQNINMTQGILDRLFGLYNVRIETAAKTSKSASSFAIPGLNSGDAEKLKDFLLSKARFGKDNL